MNIKRSLPFIPLLGLILLPGCASTEKLSIQTEPSGAEVFLQRCGDLEVHAAVEGVYGALDADSIGEDFYWLGTTPLEYEFDLREHEAAVYSPRAGGSVSRHFTEGTIRIVREGYQTVERLVRFSGSPISLVVPLQSVNED
jgi:hypothetical protein